MGKRCALIFMANGVMKLIRKGAEANIYLATFMGRKAVMKRRISKSYRIKEVDMKIRDYRTVHEAQLLHEAKTSGVPTPAIYFVNREKSEIIMEYVDGVRLKDFLDREKPDKAVELCFQLGKLIGNLHENNIIHGDLTTSNVVLTSDGKMFFLDFGLGFYSNNTEAQGVDLHLLKQVFQSYHYKIEKECFEAVLKGYETVVGMSRTEEAMKKIKEIEGRGRYIPPEARFHH